MFDRIAPVYDVMNRVMTAGLDQRWRRATVEAVVEPGDRVLDAACGTGDLAVAAAKAGANVTGLDFSEAMLERARRKSSDVEWVQRRPARAAVRRTRPSTPRRSASASATSPTSSAGSTSCAACCVRAAASASSRSRGRAGRCGSSTRSGSTASCRCSARCFPAARPTRTSRRACAAFPGPDELAALMRGPASATSRYRLFAGGIVALHTGTARVTSALAAIRAAPGLDAYLDELEARLERAVATHPGVVAAVGSEALAAGGKRLRPLLVFLCAPRERRRRRSRPASRSSSSTWRRSCTTT